MHKKHHHFFRIVRPCFFYCSKRFRFLIYNVRTVGGKTPTTKETKSTNKPKPVLNPQQNRTYKRHITVEHYNIWDRKKVFTTSIVTFFFLLQKQHMREDFSFTDSSESMGSTSPVSTLDILLESDLKRRVFLSCVIHWCLPPNDRSATSLHQY